jgi:hypothetical protein
MSEGPNVAPEARPGTEKEATAGAAAPVDLRAHLAASFGKRTAALTQMVRDVVEGIGQGGRVDKFTEKARLALQLAEGEARRMKHNYIGTEHLLLGAVASDGVAGRVLAEVGVGPAQLREAVSYVIGEGKAPARGEVSLTPRAKRSIEAAVGEANRLRHAYVGTEHLLLGVAAVTDGVGAVVLEQLGAGLGPLRAAVEELATRGGYVPEAVGTKDSVITCRLDPADLWAVDILVEAGIRTTRSDAAQWLIHAGIESNRELFDQVQGTVAEIRRLRERARELAGAAGRAPEAGRAAGKGEDASREGGPTS